MKDNFNELNHYYFYTCFSQLISRITHSNSAVFKTLKVLFIDHYFNCFKIFLANFI